MPHAASPASASAAKPTILHLGEPIVHHPEFYRRLKSRFDFINPPPSACNRTEFISHLRSKTWGDFSAIMRPFWNTGGEMGKWDKEVIDLLPKTVKVYASAGAGYDWVDIQALADKGILYCNARGASTEAVADMALYYVISVFRNMPVSHLSARSLDPDRFNHAHFHLPLKSHNPRGHTLGIIGLGDIGFAIAKKVHAALGMKILYNDIERKATSLEEQVDAVFHLELDGLLAKSDCVLVATPFSGETLITRDRLAKFKRGSRLVNIARGSLIDEDALADHLDSGHISGAGLDVHANEPHVNPRLANNWKVGITSHTGGGALETWVAFERLALENVERVLTGMEALTPVNRHLFRNTDHDDADTVNGDAEATKDVEMISPIPMDDGAGSANGHVHRKAGNIGDTHMPIANELNGDMPRPSGIARGA